MLFDDMFALVQYSLGRHLRPRRSARLRADRTTGTVDKIAADRGEDPLATLYDLMLEADATTMLMLPFFNYSYGNHDAIREMLTHPAGVLGLSDGGAHCGMICDASYPTFLLTHWARDRHRGEKLPLEYLVRKQSHDTAQLFGLTDRGVIEVGKKADINVIDMDALHAARAEDGLRPARRRAAPRAGRLRLQRHHRQRRRHPARRRRHRRPPRPVGARSALKTRHRKAAAYERDRRRRRPAPDQPVVEVQAPASELFAIVADPTRHHEVDGSGTVRDNIRAPAKPCCG